MQTKDSRERKDMQRSGSNRRPASHRRITLESEGDERSASARRSSKHRSDNRSLHSSLPPKLNAMTTKVECHTENGGKKSVVLYKKGMEILYKGPNGLVPARILECHFDDLLEPYYTILREDGVEKQTDNDHLCMYPEPVVKQQSSRNATGPELEDGIRVMTTDEQRQKRKKAGLCPTCGQVQTHKPGLWRSKIPDTVEGLVYKGVCLKCSSLDVAKLKLGEPIDSRPGFGRGGSIQLKRPSLQVKRNSQPASKGSSSKKLLRRMASADNHNPKRKSMTPAFLRRSTGTQSDAVTESQSPPESPPSNLRQRASPEVVPLDDLPDVISNNEPAPRIHSSRRRSQTMQQDAHEQRMMRHRSTKEVVPLDELPDMASNHELAPRKDSAQRRSQSTQQKTVEEQMIRHRSAQEIAPLDELPDTTSNNNELSLGISARIRPQYTQPKTLEDHLIQINGDHSIASSEDESDLKDEFGFGQRETLVRNNVTTADPQSGDSESEDEFGFGQRETLVRNNVTTKDPQWGHTMQNNKEEGVGVSKSNKSSLAVAPSQSNQSAHQLAIIVHPDDIRESQLTSENGGPDGPPWMRSQTLSTEPDSAFSESNIEESKCTMEPNDPNRNEVVDFRCCDSNGQYGFYSGTVEKMNDGQQYPQGRGEMTYDEGSIVKGTWSMGALRVRVPAEHERYEPYLLPGFRVGDIGHKDDMIKSSAAAISMLHVSDCCFVRRSDGSWTYAILVSRTDSEDAPSLVLRVKPRGSTKTISQRQWAGHVRLAAKPDILDGFKVGDAGNASDMITAEGKEAVKQVMKLRVGDAAFVRRSNGTFTYAFVIQKTMGADGRDGFITFEVNQEGCTKTSQISQSAGSICRIRHMKPSQKRHKAATTKEEDIAFNLAQDTTSLVLVEPTVEGRQDAIAPLEPEGNYEDNNYGEKLPKSSSFLEKDIYSQKLQGIYQDLDEKSPQSGNQQEPQQVLAIYDNRHHDCDGDDLALTDDACSSLDGYNSMTDTSEGKRIKDALMKSLISRRRRRATQENLTDEDSIAESTSERLVRHIARDGSLERSWESYRKTRKDFDEKNDLTDEGYLSLTDGSKHNVRAHARDALLINLLARATLEQTQHAADGDDHSLDNSIASITESFLEWRKQKKKGRDKESRDKKAGDKKHKKKKREKKSSKRRKDAASIKEG